MANPLIVVAVTALMTASHAFAQVSLPDPTRPFAGPEAGPSGLTDAVEGQGAMVLQSVVIRPGRKPRALIGGEWVEQGGIYAGARVMKITTEGVILRGASGTEELSLTPGIRKEKAARKGREENVR